MQKSAEKSPHDKFNELMADIGMAILRFTLLPIVTLAMSYVAGRLLDIVGFGPVIMDILKRLGAPIGQVSFSELCLALGFVQIWIARPVRPHEVAVKDKRKDGEVAR